MILIIWSLLIIIGVFDAREYRIPNVLVLLLVGVNLLDSLLYPSENFQGWWNHIAGFAVVFLFGLIFYTLNIMAAGDVKLLGAIGLILGLNQLPLFAQFIALNCAFIGSMYWLLNRLQLSGLTTRVSKTRSSIAHSISVQAYQLKDDFKSRRNLAYMPFAPVLIIAFAMYEYFKH